MTLLLLRSTGRDRGGCSAWGSPKPRSRPRKYRFHTPPVDGPHVDLRQGTGAGRRLLAPRTAGGSAVDSDQIQGVNRPACGPVPAPVRALPPADRRRPGTPPARTARRGPVRERLTMAMKALLRGHAGAYKIRGTIWEFGSSAYRAYVHLVPAAAHSRGSGSVLCAQGATLQQVLDATQARVGSTVGRSVERLEIIPGAAPPPEPDPVPRDTLASRRAGPTAD